MLRTLLIFTERMVAQFVFDVMEPLRPLVERSVLDLLREREFTKSDFFETSEVIVRILPPLSETLSGTASRWRGAVELVVEDFPGEIMAWSDGGERGALTRRDGNTVEGAFTPTTLTKDNRRSGSFRSVKRKQARSTYESWKANWEWEAEHGDERPNID